MTYKKVTPISKGVLRIRSEPDAESQTETEAKVDAAVKKAESAARKAEQAAKACDGIAAGMNVVIDSVTGKACEIGMTDGNIVVREA